MQVRSRFSLFLLLFVVITLPGCGGDSTPENTQIESPSEAIQPGLSPEDSQTELSPENVLTEPSAVEIPPELPSKLLLKAWVGATDTEVILPTEAQGLTLTRSTDRNCDLDNYSVCDMGQQDVLTTTNLTDTAANLSQSAWYWLDNGDQTSQPLTISTDKLPRRMNH